MTAFISGFPAVLVTVHPHYLDPLSMEGTPGFKKEPSCVKKVPIFQGPAASLVIHYQCEKLSSIIKLRI